jgi:nanoRNase/pAp phosphatase (c-di-AMP/oligoRNAs hydrolase)
MRLALSITCWLMVRVARSRTWSYKVDDLEAADIPVLIIVDHHKAQERISLQFTESRHGGSVATIYAGYLEQSVVQIEKSRTDRTMVAVALLHGVITEQTA